MCCNPEVYKDYPEERPYPIWEFLLVEGQMQWGQPPIGSLWEAVDIILMRDKPEHFQHVRIYADGHAEISQYVGDIMEEAPGGGWYHQPMWVDYSPLSQGWGGLSPVNAGIPAFPR